MKLNIYMLMALVFCLGGQDGWAQNSGRQAVPEQPEIVKCLSYEGELELRESYPELGTIEEFEARIAPLVEETKRQRANGERGGIVTIPIIFHVVYNTATQNLGAQYINAQLEQLNNDFGKIEGTSGDNDEPAGADTEVRFCMAVRDPEGNLLAEPGIERLLYSDLGINAPPYSDSYVENVIYPLINWDSDKYLNVLIADLSGGLLGKAVFPAGSGLPGLPASGGDPAKDAVMITRQSVGSTDVPNPFGGQYNAGRTMTHEVGHWLGLRHIWGDGACGVDDFCDDTPASDFQNFGCPANHVSCGTRDMVENYMDYTDDACMNVYTEDQRDRIQTVLATARSGLGANAETACDPDAVFAAFIPSALAVCEGGSVLFTDNSVGDNIISWDWDFGDGGSSDQQSPTYTFNTAGNWTVMLTVNDGSNDYSTTVDILVSTSGVFDHLNGGTLINELAANEGGTSGYVGGHNSFGDNAKAEYFAEGTDGATLGDVEITFAVATAPGAQTLRCVVWDEDNGEPGSEIAAVNIAINSIATDGSPTVLDFGEPTLNGPFFVGVELNYNNNTDVAIFTNENGDTNPTTAWERWSDNTWHSFNDGTQNTWQWDAALAITAELLCEDSQAPVAPVAAFSADATTVCEGVEISFTDMSTNSPTSWSWDFGDGNTSDMANPTHTYTTDGDFTVTLTAGNAAGSDDEVKTNYITVEPEPTGFSGIVSANTTCSGESVNLSMSGTFAGAYTWMNGPATISNTTTATVSPTGTTTYTAICDDGVCRVESDVTVTVNQLPDVPAVANAGGGMLSATSGTPGTWQWFLNGNPIPNAVSPVFMANESGDYTVQIMDVNGCISTSSVTAVTISAVFDEALNTALELYPNPVSRSLNVDFNNYPLEGLTIKLVDLSGRELQSITVDNASMNIDMTGLSDGLYLLKLETDDSRFAVRKVVKQQ